MGLTCPLISSKSFEGLKYETMGKIMSRKCHEVKHSLIWRNNKRSIQQYPMGLNQKPRDLSSLSHTLPAILCSH